MYTPLKEQCLDELKEMSNEFKVFPLNNGFCYGAIFPNNYGISIIKHDGSYGRECDEWEIGVLRNGKLCYTTPITDDVIGWLTDDEVMEVARNIAKLEDREYDAKKEARDAIYNSIQGAKKYLAGIKERIGKVDERFNELDKLINEIEEVYFNDYR